MTDSLAAELEAFNEHYDGAKEAVRTVNGVAIIIRDESGNVCEDGEWIGEIREVWFDAVYLSLPDGTTRYVSDATAVVKVEVDDD